MEFLVATAIIVVLGLSANRVSDRKTRSRYDPVPKPPVSISRSYKEDSPVATKERQNSNDKI